MKFFLPAARTEEIAEQTYAGIAKFISAKLPNDDKRIHSIKYTHNGINMTATVGKDCDSYYRESKSLVIAIFKSTPYKVCLAERGVLGGEPILVGNDTISEEVFFDK